MTLVLLRKYVQDAKWLLIACGGTMFAFCWIRVWIVSRLDTGRFKAILDLLPSDWQRFTPVEFDWLITYTGRISLAYDELIVVLCVSIWAIARGSDCVSGEIGRGTLEMLIAQPLSRFKVIATHSLVTVTGVALLSLAAWGGTCAGIYNTTVTEKARPTWQLPIPLPWIGTEMPIPFSTPVATDTPMSEKVDVRVFLPATANLFALGLMVAGFTTMMSSWDRYRWRTIGIVVGIYVFQIIVKLVGLAADEVNWMLYFSAFTPYEPEAFVHMADVTPEFAWSLSVYDVEGSWKTWGPMAHHFVMATIGIMSYVAAAAIFVRRDLPAPM